MKLPDELLKDPEIQRGLALRRSVVALGVGALIVVISLAASRAPAGKDAVSGTGVGAVNAPAVDASTRATPDDVFEAVRPQDVEVPAEPPRYPGDTVG